MNKILESITASVQALTTMAAFNTTTGVSGSACVDMAKYNHVIARVNIGKLPDNKGALSMATLTLYENSSNAVAGSAITVSIVTNALISNSAETILQTEIKADQLSSGYRYVYAHFNVNTKSDCSIIIERAGARYTPQ